MKLTTIGLLLLLTACGSNVPLISTRYRVVNPPENFYVCIKPSIPEGNLTDSQVSNLLVDYEENITNCQNNLNAIRSFLQENSGPSANSVTQTN